MREIQEKIKRFNDEREWSEPHSVKDLLLNMNEEIGELWNIIKWVDTETQLKLVSENKEEVGNFIGDMIYLILKIAYLYNIDAKEEIEKVIAEYEKRFPKDRMKGNHGNILAGGIDLKNHIEKN